MAYDPQAPEQLVSLQKWFASVITLPLDREERLPPVTGRGEPLEKEVAAHILPSPTLAPHQRIELYSQQYWWRLIRVMGDIFPLLLRLFGQDGFRESIATPFLMACPPNHWSLELLGERLEEWLLENYTAEDRYLTLDACRLDWAYSYAVVAGERPPLTQEEMEDPTFPTQKIYLQPFVTPLSFPCELFAFRKAMLAHEQDYWVEHPFPELPPLEGGLHVAFYRTPSCTLAREDLDRVGYALLAEFERGTPLAAACETLSEEFSPEELQAIPTWLQNWATRGWLTLSPRRSLFTSF